MTEDAPTPEPTPPPRKKKHFSMLRSFAPADIITIGNAACGTASIFLCLSYLGNDLHRPYLWAAFGLLPAALLFDALDGFVARKTRRASVLGADLDSLADIVSFGVAPAVLAFTIGMRSVLDAVVLVYFVVCGISRLARYNVTAAELADDSGKVRYYEGTPIPTSLALVLAMAVAFGLNATHDALWFGQVDLGPLTFHPLVLLFALSGSAMISATLRIPKP